MNKAIILFFLILIFSCSVNKPTIKNKDSFCKINQKTVSLKTNKNYNCDFNYADFKKTIKQFNLKENELKKYVFLIGCSDAGTIRMTNNYDALIYNIETHKIYRYSTNKYDGKSSPIKNIFSLQELKNIEKRKNEFNFLIYNFVYNKSRFDKITESLKFGSNISEVSCQRFFYYVDNENIEESYLKVFWNGFFKLDEN